MQKLNTINIKGKEYVLVSDRIKYFRSSPDYIGWRIITEIVNMDEKRVVMKATIFDKEGIPIATGHAYEDAGSSFINKTSFIENAETSCVGRALGLLGIGIDESVASAEEVANAIINQTKTTTKSNGYAQQPAGQPKAALKDKNALITTFNLCKNYKELELAWINHKESIKALNDKELSSLLDVKECLKEKYEEQERLAKEDVNI